MTDLCSIDGRLTPRSEGLPEGVYLYQRLRAVDHRPLHAAAHLRLLREASLRLYGRTAELPEGRIAGEIGALLRANGYPAGGATVTLRLYADGRRAITADGVSLYRGYTLRSLRPAAAVVPWDDRSGWHTSARREAVRWAQLEAGRHGARCAILCDGDGAVRRADDAPLFAVHEGVIYASPAAADVERTLVIAAARRAGIPLTEQLVGAGQLGLFDELFVFDCEGVCSIASCGEARYLSLTAERIAEALAALPER